jgi:hypothetical protein
MIDRRLIECEIETWQRYGAYLTGVTGIAKRWPNLTFDRFYSILCSYPSHGGWAKEALRRAFEGK